MDLPQDAMVMKICDICHEVQGNWEVVEKMAVATRGRLGAIKVEIAQIAKRVSEEPNKMIHKELREKDHALWEEDATLQKQADQMKMQHADLESHLQEGCVRMREAIASADAKQLSEAGVSATVDW